MKSGKTGGVSGPVLAAHTKMRRLSQNPEGALQILCATIKCTYRDKTREMQYESGIFGKSQPVSGRHIFL